MIPKINLMCESQINETTGLLTVEARWGIPDPERNFAVLRAIGSYDVSFEWQDDATMIALVEIEPDREVGILLIAKFLLPVVVVVVVVVAVVVVVVS